MYWHSIELLLWKKHWSDGFVDPNERTRIYMYMLQTLKDNCTSFEDYNYLVSLFESSN